MTRACLLTLALVGCTSADYTDGIADQDTWGSDDGAGRGDGAGEPPADSDGEVPPEVEREFRLAPAQTDVFVFVANTSRDTVTRIDVRTREVRTVAVGRRPTVVAVTPGYDRAVVFNAGDDTVSLIDAATLEQVVVPVRDNLNAMALSPDGHWAVLWHDVNARVPDDSGPGAAASYNEVSLVDVYGERHVARVVGFNPKSVRFTPDGALAVVVADASMAALPLTGDAPEPTWIAIADPLAPPAVEEVVLDPAGRYAFVRQRGLDAITIVDLATRDVVPVPVGEAPTDLDLTPDGAGAVVVSRGARQVQILSTAAPFDAPKVVPFGVEEPFGSVLMGEEQAILYTTTGTTSRYATWNLATDDIVVHPLPKPVAGMARTPPGTSLLVVHPRDDNADGTTPSFFRGVPAVSLIDLDDHRVNTIALKSDVLGFANSHDGRRGYLVAERQPALVVLDYTTLIHDLVPLRSAPEFIGVLPDLTPGDGDEPPAWVTQEHPLGRISFYDPDEAELETITGFELNGAIED